MRKENILNENYLKFTEKVIADAEKSGKKPTLLLHVCCAPCSSSVLEYLSRHFSITLLYYNPNITEKTEYELRFDELVRLLSEMPGLSNVEVIKRAYSPDDFIKIAKGLETAPEGGERCTRCYRLRLAETAKTASENGFDYFTTTLSVSPYKDARRLNAIGGELALQYNVAYLFSDFKKKNGYKRSIELSHIYGLYRQDYCGCVYSKEEARMRRLEKSKNV